MEDLEVGGLALAQFATSPEPPTAIPARPFLGRHRHLSNDGIAVDIPTLLSRLF